MNDYKPRPGSIGEKAILHLGVHGRLSARDLADGIECEHGSLHASLNLAVASGVVKREADGGITFYSLSEPVAMSDVTTIEEQKPRTIGPVTTDTNGDSRFECGLFSDGRLVLEIGDSVFTFTKAEKDRLLNFLLTRKEAH